MTKIRALLAVIFMTCRLLLGSVTVSAAQISQTALAARDVAVRKGQEIDFIFSLGSYVDMKKGIHTVKGKERWSLIQMFLRNWRKDILSRLIPGRASIIIRRTDSLFCSGGQAVWTAGKF